MNKHSSIMAAMQELAIKAYSRMSMPYTHQRTAPVKRMTMVALDSLATWPINWGMLAVVEQIAANIEIKNMQKIQNRYNEIVYIVF